MTSGRRSSTTEIIVSSRYDLKVPEIDDLLPGGDGRSVALPACRVRASSMPRLSGAELAKGGLRMRAMSKIVAGVSARGSR